MSEAVTRVNPSRIPTGLKEAVVDALVNQTFAAISGAGPEGETLFGAKPRSLLSTAFLLPRPKALGDGDEVTQPIQIYAHGMDFQVNSEAAAQFKVKPSLRVYVRVLPAAEDLKRPNMELAFRLNNETRNDFQAKVRAALTEAWTLAQADGYKARHLHPRWRDIEQEVRAKVRSGMGIPANPTQARSEAESDEVAEDEGGTVASTVESTDKSSAELDDKYFQPLDIPQKWLRIPLDDSTLPELVVDVNWDAERLRTELELSSSALTAAVQLSVAAWASSEQGKLWGMRDGKKVYQSQYTAWDAFLQEVRQDPAIVLPNFDLSWHVSLTPNWLNPEVVGVHVSLENRSEEPRGELTESSVFQVSLLAKVPAQMLVPFKLGRVKPSYRYNEYLDYPATGYNGGVRRLGDEGGSLVLQTTWAPRYVQPRIVPKEHEGINRHIRALSHADGLQGVLPLGDALDNWFAGLPDAVRLSAGLDAADLDSLAREKGGFESDCNDWRKEIAAVKAGLAILSESKVAWEKTSTRGMQQEEAAIVYEAWLSMNEAMADLLKDKVPDDSGEWRLFQLAFLVAHVPTMATRLRSFHHFYDKQRDDTVTLLYFATGGGKSEAFFGLLAFGLFFDRLRGKSFGVTAMMRYPLRLLTIQQAQRCARVLAKAELVRKKYSVFGEAFSIGFWVGSGGSPNTSGDRGFAEVPTLKSEAPTPSNEKRLLAAESGHYRLRMEAWNKIPSCPFCDSPTALRVFEGLDKLLAHVCTNSKCASNEGAWTPLPFYICDADIYALAPSVILGTVDKLALIGQSTNTLRRIYGMFGAAPWRHSRTGRLHMPVEVREFRDEPDSLGYETLKPSYPEGAAGFFDPFPSLLIQDEAHLLDESLGTFAGIFESSLDAVFEEMSKCFPGAVCREPDGIRRRRAKVIAASATVSEPERQMEHLYQREVPAMQFPFPGESLYESFYAHPAAPQDGPEREAHRASDTEVWASWSRVYVAFLTNGRPHTATTVAVLASFHALISRLMLGLTSLDESRTAEARALLLQGVSDGPLASVYRAHVVKASAGQLATLIDLHRISLTYVTNKKGGDQIMAAEYEEARKKHEEFGLDIPDLRTRLITGSVPQGEIQATVREAQTRAAPGEAFGDLGTALRSVIATSAISHGVDVEELNSMFFAGMPSDVAEYIQASSRVGRTHVGFVVLLPTPQRRRDRYIVQVFDSYHRFLERMVQPAAIDRWADKAIERVLPSLIQAYLGGIRFVKDVTTAEPDMKSRVTDLSWIPYVNVAYVRQQRALVDGLCAFIYKALGLDNEKFAPFGREHYLAEIRGLVDSQLKDWASDKSMAEQSIGNFYRERPSSLQKPMTSLRDVDEAGTIAFSYRDFNGKKLSPEAGRAFMRFIRHGAANDDTQGEQ